MTKIIAYYMQGDILYNSYGGKKTEPPYLDFLLADTHPYNIQVFYNLDHTVARLCKRLPEGDLRTLWEDGILPKPPYEVKYVPKSMFAIDKFQGNDKQFTTISDMTQYMEAPIRPNLSEEQIRGLLKETVKVAWDVYNAMRKLNLSPKTLTNPVRALQNEVLSKLGLPTVDDLPDEAGEYAYNCCVGGWVESFSRGWWEKLYDWDISGGYPSQVRELIDFRETFGSWQKVTSLPQDRPEGMMGFFRAVYDTEADLHPILSTTDATRNMTINGRDENWMTLRKIDFCVERKLADISIIDGWVFTPRQINKPLRDLIDRLQEHKVKSEGMDKEIVKRLMNGLYGKMLELYKSQGKAFGPLFSSPWGAEVENNTHIEVCRFCLDNKIMPIYIMTDGIGTDVELKVESSKELGKWRLDAVTSALVIGSGAIALKDKIGKGAFSLNYDYLMDVIKNHPEYDTIHIQADGFKSMGEAIERKRLDLLGDSETDTRAIQVNGDLKRCYINEPKDFGELASHKYPSIPWDRSMFMVE